MKRVQADWIFRDLKKKMVFLAGPRQVGKTWLAKEIGKRFENTLYLNYDHLPDREIIKKEAWREKTDLLIFDELHKMPEWKNYLKGVFDTRPPHLAILVTGSARFDFLRQTGDSLAGRFFTHRLLPFSLCELDKTEYRGGLGRLLERGGFPEPLLAESAVDARRWRQNYIDGLIRTDVFDVENIHNLRGMQLLLAMLRQRVGSQVSFTSIGRDIGISPVTVIKYVQVLEALCIVFRVTPFTRNIGRSLLKEPKLYFYDNGMVDNGAGPAFENTTAVSLLKHAWALNDHRAEEWSLNYLRTKEGREVDFCLVKDGRIRTIVECKAADAELSPQLVYFSRKYGLQAVQLVAELRHERKEGDRIEVRRAENYLKELYL